jgi:hypothetical protein
MLATEVADVAEAVFCSNCVNACRRVATCAASSAVGSIRARFASGAPTRLVPVVARLEANRLLVVAVLLLLPLELDDDELVRLALRTAPRSNQFAQSAHTNAEIHNATTRQLHSTYSVVGREVVVRAARAAASVEASSPSLRLASKLDDDAAADDATVEERTELTRGTGGLVVVVLRLVVLLLLVRSLRGRCHKASQHQHHNRVSQGIAS